MKQKVLFLKLDTGHFTGKGVRITERVADGRERRLTLWGKTLIPDSEQVLELILQIYGAYDAVKDKEKYVEIIKVVHVLERDLTR